MSYDPYYSNGWRNNEEGGTPITAAALNNMEEGIQANAELLGDNSISSLGDGTVTGALNKLNTDTLQRKNELLASGTNLNDLTYGIYYLSGSRSYTNAPTGMTWGVLIHIGGQQICQIMINNSGLAFRAFASSWGTWHILS